jgi:hypothetical protein
MAASSTNVYSNSRNAHVQDSFHIRKASDEVEVEVTLRLTVGQSVCLDIEHPCGTCDQILNPVGMLLSEICGLVSVGALSDERTDL